MSACGRLLFLPSCLSESPGRLVEIVHKTVRREFDDIELGCCLSVALFAIPATIAVALVLVPIFVKTLGRHAGWPLATIFALTAAYIASHAGPVLGGEPITASLPWVTSLLPNSPVGLGFSLRMDALSLFFSLLPLGIGTIVFIYSTQYLSPTSKIMSFYVLMTAFMLAVLLLVLADDVVLLFVGWELVSLASFFLIARSGSSGEVGSVRTLLLTFMGGLLLLTAIAIMVATTSTTQLSAILTAPEWSADPTRLAIVAVLIALAGFSKAAQIPFHFWLPEAMAAATPVSAFLHAAAVVKAGIYLLMRFSGLFTGVYAWHILLIVTGMATAIMAAVFAIQKRDLKKLTAYSTVSQLGWIVATVGVGTPFALAAAILHTAAHALFKSSLFMLVGVVDHQTHTRRIDRLGPLWRKMPLTFGAAAVAAASMAALPPTLGFGSKEGMLTALLQAPLPQNGVIALMVCASIGALATFVYSARYLLGAFVDGPRDVSDIKEAKLSFVIPAALPGVLSLPAVYFLSAYDAPLDAAVEALGMESPHSHLSLWHGFNVPFAISMVVMILGIVIVSLRKHLVSPLEERQLGLFNADQFFGVVFATTRSLGNLTSRFAVTLNPYRHLIWILLAFITLGLFSVLGPGRLAGITTLEPRVTGIDRVSDLLGLAIVGLAVFSLVSTRSRMASVVLIGIVGVGVSWIMLTLGAPDVATTQLLVEFCVVVIMMLVVRHQPRLYMKESEHRARFATILATIIGIITFFGIWLLVGRHDKPQLAQWYLDNTLSLTGGNNVVAVILVEFRAFDTLGELTVLGMAGVVIAAIITSIPRSPLPGYGPGSTAEMFRDRESSRFPDVHKVPELSPFFSKYLRSTHLNSINSRLTTFPLIPILVIFAAVTFWRGHQAPGGGFVAALIAACGILFYYLAQARSITIGSDRTGPYFVGIGILLALGTGLLGYVKGSFLTPLHADILGQHVSSSLIFDGGVFLGVLGLIIIVINQMGGRNRPGGKPKTPQRLIRGEKPRENKSTENDEASSNRVTRDDAVKVLRTGTYHTATALLETDRTDELSARLRAEREEARGINRDTNGKGDD